MALESFDEIARLRAELLAFVMGELAASDSSKLNIGLSTSVAGEIERQMNVHMSQWKLQAASDRDSLAAEIGQRVTAALAAGVVSGNGIGAGTVAVADAEIGPDTGPERVASVKPERDWQNENQNRNIAPWWRIAAAIFATLAIALAVFAALTLRDADTKAQLAERNATIVAAQCEGAAAIRNGLDELGEPQKGLNQCDPATGEKRSSAACDASMALVAGLRRFERTCAMSTATN